MKIIKDFKRGDTFGLSCIYKIDGEPTDISNLDIACQIRDPDTKALVSELSVTKEDQTELENLGKFYMSPPSESTSSWPVKTLIADVQITEDGKIRSTQTFRIQVLEDVTQ